MGATNHSVHVYYITSFEKCKKSCHRYIFVSYNLFFTDSVTVFVTASGSVTASGLLTSADVWHIIPGHALLLFLGVSISPRASAAISSAILSAWV